MNHTLHLRGLLAAGVSAAALIGAAPAFAAPAPAAATGADTTVGEIIVTAERREASIQSVPIAVTAFTAKERAIEGISTVQDMTNFTPGLTYSSQLDRPVMRGLARNNNVYLSDSAVAVYYDDFFSQSTFLVGRDDMLIDQVEVLLGPQGTLYGRNAVGGLINTISKRPSDELSGEARVVVGNYGYSKVEATITGPLGGGWSFRASGVDLNQYQGYFKNLAGGPSEGDVRHDPYGDFQLQYKGDKNELWLDAYVLGFNNDRGGPGGLLAIPTSGHYDTAITTQGNLTFNPNAPYNPANVVPGSVVGMIPGSTDNPALKNIRTFAHAIPTNIELNADDNIALHLIHHFDGFDVKYVGGYSQYHYHLNTSSFFGNDNSSITQYTLAPGTGPGAGKTIFPEQNFQYETLTRWYSHELDFLSTTNNRLQWQGGVYRYDEIDDNSTPVTLPQESLMASPVANIGIDPITGKSVVVAAPLFANPGRNAAYLRYQDHIMSTGVFGQLDFKLTDTIKLTGGLRYTYDQKNGTQETRYIAFSGGTVAYPTSLGNVFDVTRTLIDLGTQKGVAHAPVLATTGKYAGDFVSGLSDTSSAITGTAGVEWTPDHETLVYARYNRGYKAFGFNSGGNAFNVEAAPEFVNDFELGVKKGFGRRLQVDADVFYYDYSNAQIPLGIILTGTEITEFINIPSAISDGFELTANWEPIDHLNLSLVYGFNNTSIQTGCSLVAGKPSGFCPQDPNDTSGVAAGARPVGPFGGIVGKGPGAVQSVKGYALPQAPRNKVAFNANYTWEFEPGNLTLSGTYIWKDKSFASIFDRVYDEAPSWNQVDARLTWSGNHDKYEVVLYVKNAFNTLGYDAAGAAYNISQPVGGGANTQGPAFDLTPPRLFGAEVHYKF